MNETMTAAALHNDFHCALLWMRSMAIIAGGSRDSLMAEIDEHDLFRTYVSPIKA